MSTEENIPVDGAGKIDPSQFPVPKTMTHVLEMRAAKLRTGGQNMQETGDDIVSAWDGLTEAYKAPEAETLYAALDPLTSNGAVIGMATNRVAGALEEFAETVREIQGSWRELKSEAEAFRAQIADEGEDWDKGEGFLGWGDSSNVDKNDAFLLRASNLVEDFKEAEVACANKINIGIDGRTDFLSEDALDGAMPEAHQFVHGVGVDLEEIPTSWGEAAASTDHGWVRDVGDAVWDFGVGAVEGTGAMLGAHSSQGWFAQSWGDSLKEYHWDNLTSAASLVGMYDAESDSLGWTGLDSAGEAWKDLAHSVVPWEEWGDRPGYVIGTGLLNIGSMVGGAVLTATGVGAVVGVPLMAWRGMAILDGMGGSGRGGAGMDVDLPDLPDVPTFGGSGAPVVNIDTSGFTPAQKAELTASLDRLNATAGGGSGGGGGGSGSNESATGGGRPNQSASSESEPNKPKKPTASGSDPAATRDEAAQGEDIVPERRKDEPEEPWESAPGDAEFSAANPSGVPSLEQQPTASDALTVERLMDPVSAQNTSWRDTFGPAFRERDPLTVERDGGASSGSGPEESGSPSRVPGNDEPQLVGAAARGDGEGAFSQAASSPSSSIRVANLTGIGDGPNNGRPGGEIADNHGSGDNGPSMEDRGPTAFNQNGRTTPPGHTDDFHGASTHREITSAPIQSNSDTSSPPEGNSSNEIHSARGASDLPERSHHDTGREGDINLDDSSSTPKNAWDDPSRRLPDPDISKDPSPLESIGSDSNRAPNREDPFDTRNLEPNKHYEVYDKSGRYRGIYSTGPDGKIVEIRTFPGESGSRNPDLGKPLPRVNYIIDSTKPGSDKKFVFQTDASSRTIRAYGELDLLDKADKKYRHNDQQSAAGNEGKDYFDDPKVDRGNPKSASLKDAFERVAWNGGHLIGTKFGGTGHSINLFAQMELTNKHQKGPSVPHVNFRDLEVALANILKDSNNRVDFEIECLFAKESDVPTAIRVKALVNGKPPLLTTHRRDPNTGELIKVQKEFPVLEYVNSPPIKEGYATSLPSGNSTIEH